LFNNLIENRSKMDKELQSEDLVKDPDGGKILRFITMFQGLYLCTPFSKDDFEKHETVFVLKDVELIKPESGDLVYVIDTYGNKGHWPSLFVGMVGDKYVLYGGPEMGKDPYFEADKIIVVNEYFHGETPKSGL
jgi:hypothetical protein